MCCAAWRPRRRAGSHRGGHLLMETSDRQALQAMEIVAGNDLAPRVARSDDLDATVIVAAINLR